MKSSPKKRLDFIDISKGLGILAIILVHTGFLPLQHQILPLLTPWMLPVFAVTSSMTATGNTQKRLFEILFKKTKKLLFPYIIYGLISYILWLELRWYSPDSVVFDTWEKPLINFISGRNLVFNGPLWFLPAFFISSFLFSQTQKYFNRLSGYKIFIISLLVAFLSVGINPAQTKLPFSIDLALLFWAFSISGILVSRISSVSVSNKKWIILLFFYIALTYLNGTVDMFGRIYGHWFLYYLTAVLGSLLIIRLSVWISQSGLWFKSFLSDLGINSIIVFATHWPVMQWLTLFMSEIGILSLLSAVPTYSTFSYFIPNKYLFTLIEIPLLLFYTSIPLMILPVSKSLKYFKPK